MTSERIVKLTDRDIHVLRWLADGPQIEFFAPLDCGFAIHKMRDNDFIKGFGWQSSPYEITDAGRTALSKVK